MVNIWIHNANFRSFTSSDGMFENMQGINTIFLDSANFTNINFSNMFTNCPNLFRVDMNY